MSVAEWYVEFTKAFLVVVLRFNRRSYHRSLLQEKLPHGEVPLWLLVDHHSSDGVTIKIAYVLDILLH